MVITDKTLFKVKHREQLNAIKTLMSADETKRKSLVIKLVENIEKVRHQLQVVSESSTDQRKTLRLLINFFMSFL